MNCASSNFAAWHMTLMRATAQVLGFCAPLFGQSVLNLLTPDVEREVLPACRHFGLGCLAYSRLAEAVLAGRGRGSRRDLPTWRGAALICRSGWRRGSSLVSTRLAPLGAAISCLGARNDGTSVVVGPRTLEQFAGALDAVVRGISPEVIRAVAAPWAGPGEAPEAYSC